MGDKNNFDDLDWLESLFKNDGETKEETTVTEEPPKSPATRIIEDDEAIDEQRLEEITTMELPTDFENIFTLDPRAAGVHADTASDGLIFSLCNVGRVDIEYISAVTGLDYKDVISELKGSIYQNPDKWEECFYKGWETAEEYISGNLIRKFKAAEKANKKYKGYFQSNVDALQAAMPPTVSAEEIFPPPYAPWMPADVIDDFIDYVLGPEIPNLSSSVFRTRHSEELATWEIPGKERYSTSRYYQNSYSMYGTDKLSALAILERTLNQRTVAVYDEVYTGGKTKSGNPQKAHVLNEAETVLALDRQERLLDEFKKWIWTDPKRKERLQAIYEERYASTKVRHFDGSFLTFPGLNPEVELYPYQKNAVARILFTPNTLLAHDVGSGKTLVMICAGMELRRMGISRKNIFVVPNNLVGQWRDTFLYLYKDANILVVQPSDFTPEKKWGTLALMRDNDYDGIIIACSCFERIPMSKGFEVDKLEDQIKTLEKNAQSLYSNSLSAQRKGLEKQLNDKILSRIDPEEVSFDKLGINTIFLDEAHNYKNVPVETKIDHVPGISSGGSDKCQGMMDKVLYVQRTNDGRGAVFATGTPITNSLTDAYVMQSYLQSGELKLLGLSSFDGWISMFAERHTDFEVDIDTTKFRMATRFSKFHNLPELTSLFSMIADFHTVDKKDKDLPDFLGYNDNSITPDPLFVDYLKKISHRADEVRRHKVPRNVDNLLVITTDGRKAALDLRLVEPGAVHTTVCKSEQCAKNVYDIYKAYPDKTQLVFSDYGTPKATFNVYTEIKKLLVSYGIPAKEIDFVHSATDNPRRDRLFEKVRLGKIRVLIGSTTKLGVGVNVQDKLVAIHHLDVPWRPADMIQREGRILRQGNTNSQVFIHRYITEGSFDAYSWQLLETKQRFITSLLAGHITDRASSDIYDTVLNYAEIKALAIGNPAIKERIETANELDKLIILRRENLFHKDALRQELIKLPARVERQEQNIANARLDIEHYEKSRVEMSTEEKISIRTELEIALTEHVMQQDERVALEYQGFSVVIPPAMVNTKPCVWLKANGKYYLELTGSPLAYISLIDKYLDGLSQRLSKYEDNLDKLQMVKSSIEAELAEDDRYSERIDQLSKKLEELDEQLGVVKQ